MCYVQSARCEGRITLTVEGQWCAVVGCLLVLAGAPLARASRVPAGRQGIRVVDAVDANDPQSEKDHGLAGRGLGEGLSGGRKWRNAREWFSYRLKTYEDSPLTLVCLFAAPEGGALAFDVLVDGRNVATRTVEPRSPAPVEIDIHVPEAISLGKISVTVKFVAHRDGVTPGLLELRTVQEHLERPLACGAPVRPERPCSEPCVNRTLPSEGP
jgi:hypothetical protein